MISKFLHNTYRSNNRLLILRKIPPKIVNVRYADIIPPTQYDTPFPRRLKIGSLVRNNWEILPLVMIVLIDMAIVVIHTYWGFTHKTDVVFKSHSRDSISRTMDLRNPTYHKMINVNQHYEPWPEMQDVLDKMILAEKRAFVRAKACSQA